MTNQIPYIGFDPDNLGTLWSRKKETLELNIFNNIHQWKGPDFKNRFIPFVCLLSS